MRLRTLSITSLCLLALACSNEQPISLAEHFETTGRAISPDEDYPGEWCPPYSAVYLTGEVGYGEMGVSGCDGSLPMRMRCAAGLTSHNVDSRPGMNWAPARQGWFSCWNNWPDAICYSQPQINVSPWDGWGINVRDSYGSIDYGCGSGT